MNILRRTARQLKAQALVIGYLLTGLSLRLTIQDKWILKRILTQMSSRYCAAVLRALNIEVEVSGLSPAILATLKQQGPGPPPAPKFSARRWIDDRL